MRPLLLDLFCAAGGCARGYYDAGFDVIGIDNRPQPNYPYPFILADALNPPVRLEAFDAIHASPPCQHYMRSGNVNRDEHPDLLPATRAMLERSGVPWVIENVPGAPMRADAVLCGSMFGLPVRRHRWFEFSDGLPRFPPFACDHTRPIVGVYGHPHGKNGAAAGMLPSTLETWSEGLGIDWMTAAGLALAIPPAYTEWIGTQLLAQVPVSVPEPSEGEKS